MRTDSRVGAYASLLTHSECARGGGSGTALLSAHLRLPTELT